MCSSSLQIELQNALEDILSETSIENGLLKLEYLLQDGNFETLHALVEEMKHWDTLTTIPEPKSFLFTVRLQPYFGKMLENSFLYQPYLVCFITRFGAVNEVSLASYCRPTIKVLFFSNRKLHRI